MSQIDDYLNGVVDEKILYDIESTTFSNKVSQARKALGLHKLKK